MKRFLFILTINFLICNCVAEFTFSSPLNSFLSYFGINQAANPAQYEENLADSDVDDFGPEREHDPLYLVLVSLDGKTLMGALGNFILFGQYVESAEFVDMLFACPIIDGKQTKGVNKTETVPDKTLFIEKNFKSMVKKYENQASQSAESNKTDAKNIPLEIAENTNSENPNSDQAEQSKPNKDSRQQEVLQSTAIELDSDHRKDTQVVENFNQGEQSAQQEITHLPEENNEIRNLPPGKRNEPEHWFGFVAPEDDAIRKKNKPNSGDGLDHDKMEIDSGPNKKTDEADANQTHASQSETQNGEASAQKIGKILDSLTTETIKEVRMKALDEARKFKCEKPVRTRLFQYPGDYKYKVYTAGFDIMMGQHSNLNYPEFKQPTKEKYKWFWSFTIIINVPDHSVVCVYQDFQYNKDTYSPEINDDFDDHDLGKDLIFPGLDISNLYEIKNQETVFSNLFQNEEERKKYFDIAEGKYLLRVHLAPLHSFVSPVVRQTAKTYGNIAPMWNSIRNGAWRTLDEYVSILSHVLVDLVVITGTYGILNLDGKDVYLADDEKVPVPLAFWKMVIYGSETKYFRGMLIITSNNPYEDIGEIICKENKCAKYGWGNVQQDDIAKGRTRCCEFTPKILEFLPILEGAQPPNVLDLYNLSLFVENTWKYSESGEKTTWAQRNTMLEKLKLKKKVDEKTVGIYEKLNGNLKNEEIDAEAIPVLIEGKQGVDFAKKHVAM